MIQMKLREDGYRDAVKEAGISTDDVWYVNAHGTSTHHNDLFETIAIKKTFQFPKIYAHYLHP